MAVDFLNNLNFFSITDNQLYFYGIGQQADFLWNLPERFDLAKKNIEQQQTTAATSVFIGSEHLAFIGQQPKTNQPVIVVEKSQLLYDFYKSNKLIPAELPEGVYLVLGEWGFYSPHTDPSQQINQLINELGKIILQLFKLPKVDWNHVQIYLLPTIHLDKNFIPCFKHFVALIIHAKLFHVNHQATYQKINEAVKSKKIIFFELNQEDLAYSKVFDTTPDYLFRGMEKITYVFGGTNNKEPLQRLFPFGSVQDQVIGEQAAAVFKSFMDKAQDLLQLVEQQLPSYIVWRNRTIFDHLEDMLFTEQMFQYLNIPCIQYFTDLYNQLSSSWSGGWSYALSRDYFKSDHTYTLGLMSLLDQWYGPKEPPVRTYRLRYPHMYDEVASVVTSKDQIKYDISVVHSGPFTEAISAVVEELAQIVTAFSCLEYGKAISFYLRRLREYLSTKYSKIFSYDHQLTLSAIDWSCYLLCRVQRMRACLPVFLKYRSRIFGLHWDKIIPAELHGGFLPTNQEVRNVYRHSLVSVILSQTVTTEFINHGIVNALNAGGLPIVYRPSFTAGSAPAYDFLKEDSLPYINNAQELDSLVQNLQKDWGLRQTMIETLREKVLMPIRDVQSYPNIDQLMQQLPPVYQAKIDLSFCKNTDLETLLLEVGMAYVFYFSGYRKLASDILYNVIKTEKINSPLLDQRVIKMAEQ